MGSDGGGPAGFWWIDTITLTSPCILPDRIHIDEHASTNGPVGTVLNGVLEPNETVVVEPSHSNDGDSAVLLTGSAGIFGPDGANYTILDDAADYGALIPGVFSDCYTAGNNCYLAYVSDPATRPEAHWDALLSESLSASAYKLWNLHIGDSFADAPSSSAFYPFIENIFHNGVTGGCGEGLYCPGEATLRKQMAVFVLKAKFGRSYEPRACTGAFTDVPCPGTFTDWIEDLYARGIVAGCGPGPAYCPDNPVSRQQMAVFLLKTLNGSGYTPPACVGTFPDVPCTNPFAPWIEDLADRQITGGCGGGNYCPTAATTRGQMAPFLVKTFGLLLYGS
ncbi:MAG: S-layer homology domain-containing protein [Thermoanaerobaculia bacterium]